MHRFQEIVVPGERRSLLAVDWEPWEISLVPIPADPGAQIRDNSANSQAVPCTIISRSTEQSQTHKDDIAMPNNYGHTGPESDQMRATDAPASVSTSIPDMGRRSQENQLTEQTEMAASCVTVAAIRAACRNAGLTADNAMDIIERHENTALDHTALMAEIGRRFAERDTPAQTVSRVSVTRDEAVTRRSAMTDAILCRMAPASNTITDAARDYRGMSLMRLAEETLLRENVRVRGMSPVELAERALHSSSDFPNILSNVLNKRLRQAYEESQPSYRLWARRAPNAPDFKPIDVVQMSAMPDLLRTNEAGEFKYGTASDGKISYSVLTYGRILGVTRQTLVNDDLRALDRLTTGYAAAAARLENRTVYAQLAGSGTYGGGDLFTTQNGNLAESGTTINATTLGAGRAALRKQKGLQKEELNIAPRYLIVPTDLEQLSYQFTSTQFVPAKATDVNEFRAGGRTALEPIVEAVLDGHSDKAWYLAADSAQVDTIEYAYLDGAEGVQLSSRIGFNVDGVEFKASLDFAAAAIDHRGFWKNPGA
ncbi:prohead protease/major capsid protein fusion protein [Iodidimonas nitroreducens]